MNPMNPMHSCKRVSELLSQSMDEPLNWFDALRMRIHLSMCSNCRNVEEQVLGMQAVLTKLLSAEDLPDGRGPPTGPDAARAARPDA